MAIGRNIALYYYGDNNIKIFRYTDEYKIVNNNK